MLRKPSQVYKMSTKNLPTCRLNTRETDRRADKLTNKQIDSEGDPERLGITKGKSTSSPGCSTNPHELDTPCTTSE